MGENESKKDCEKHRKCVCEQENKFKEDKEEVCGCVDCTCEQPKDNYLEMAQRIQAEFDNYRKRSADVVKIARQDGVADAVKVFLPALDSFQKAKNMTRGDMAMLEGICLVEKKIKDSLEDLDIQEIESEGQHYDPKYHNVVAIKHDNALEDGIIVEVYQAGYKIKDKIIRYAQVIVNKNKED